MKRGMVFWSLIVTLLFAFEAHGRAFEVRPLGEKKSGIWGTDEFSLSVSRAGVIRYVKVRGKEVIWQAAALYTAPVPPDQKKPLRKVQGEGTDTRGLGMKLPTMRTRDEDGKRIFEFDHVLATSQIMDGRSLCNIREKIVITPTGEIDVIYDFEWLQTLRWNNFGHLIIPSEKTCRDREYLVQIGDSFHEGKLDKGPIATRRIRSKPFDQLTLRPEVGPVHFVWTEEAKCSFHWGGGLQVHVAPKSTQYRGSFYKGQKERIAYRILLPVSQQ